MQVLNGAYTMHLCNHGKRLKHNIAIRIVLLRFLLFDVYLGESSNALEKTIHSPK